MGFKKRKDGSVISDDKGTLHITTSRRLVEAFVDHAICKKCGCHKRNHNSRQGCTNVRNGVMCACNGFEGW